MKKYLVTLILSLFAVNFTYAQAINPCPTLDHLELKIKDDKGQVDQTLCYEGFVAGYSYYYKAPLYVAYKLSKSEVEVNNGRNDNAFKEDESIPAEHRATLWDFKYSGFDRGHMLPRATGDSTPTLRDQTYLLSNMTAQHAELNQQGWRHLEAYIRDLVIAHGDLYVVTGSLFDGINRTIGKGVHVPSHLYKVVYIPSKDKMLGFIIENKPFDIDDLKSTQEKIDLIERKSGFDFFSGLVNNEEDALEKVEINYCASLGRGSLDQEPCN